MARDLTLLGLGAMLLLGCGGTEEAPPPPPPPPQTVAAPDSGAAAQAAAADSGTTDRRLTREVFEYGGGVRDPFVSLLASANTGPELPDLMLVTIILDHSDARNSVAVLRERVTNRRYSVHTGDQLGRMRVGRISRREVAFTIDDFGVARQETLTFRKVEEDNQ